MAPSFVITLLGLLLTAPAFARAPIDIDAELEDDDVVAFDDDDLLDTSELGSRGGRDAEEAKKKKPTKDSAPVTASDDDPIEDFDIEEDEDLDEDEEDEEATLGDFEEDAPRTRAAAASPKAPGPIDLEVAGKEPLSDNYPVSVVAIDRDAVVVELPVMLSRARAGVTESFMLIGEAYVGGQKVGEVRQLVTPQSLAEFGPTFAFLKMAAPVVEKQGEVKVVVKQAKADGTGSKELFSRVTAYALR